MNPLRQRRIDSGLIKTPFIVDVHRDRLVKAHPDAIKARDTNKCRVKKALAILAQSQIK